MKPYAAFRARFLEVLASIYIYNEHRGYTSLDRVLEAVRIRDSYFTYFCCAFRLYALALALHVIASAYRNFTINSGNVHISHQRFNFSHALWLCANN